MDQGWIEGPIFVQMVFGILGGVGADLDNLMHMHTIANKLFGTDYEWSVLAAGRYQMPFTTQSALLGGNVRVGLEDNLWLERGRLASNAELVEKAAGIITAMGVEIMTPAEVRAELNLVKRDPV